MRLRGLVQSFQRERRERHEDMGNTSDGEGREKDARSWKEVLSSTNTVGRSACARCPTRPGRRAHGLRAVMTHGQNHAARLRIGLVVTPLRIGIGVRGEVGRILLLVRLSLVRRFALRRPIFVTILLVFALLLPFNVS